jgi:hypothetical protein
MPNAATFFEEPTRYLIVLAGDPGSGKTRAALSFPACYVICCDPRGIEILKEPSNAPFRENLIWYDYFALESKADSAALFKPNAKADDEVSIYGAIERIKQMAKAGKIQTVVFDGLSYLADFMGIRASQVHSGTTESDKWAYYRQIKNDLTQFVQSQMWTLTRYGLHVLATTHIQRESEEQQKKRADTEAEIQPRIEGSFRAALAGMPRAMIYLDQRTNTKTDTSTTPPKKTYSVNYYAYCQRVKVGHMGLIPAKNSYGLPPVVNITDKSFYVVLEEAMGRKAETAGK